MNDAGIHLTVCRLDASTVVAELYVQAADLTVDWFPSIHVGDIDPTVIDEQIRQHHAGT